MSKILLILTILLTGAAAWFGYQTKLKVVDLLAEKANLESSLKATTNTLGKTKDDLENTKKQLDTFKDETAKATADLATANAEKDKISADKADVEKQLADVKTQLDKALGSMNTGGTPGENTNFPEQIAKLQADLKDTQAKYAESQQLTATLQAKVSDLDGKNQVLTEYKMHHEGQMAAKGLEGQVMAVNQGWNFVVVSIGDRQGVQPNAQMLIKRGDTLVAKVRISSVDPATSIADIVPESVPRGQRVMPGDRVIYPSP